MKVIEFNIEKGLYNFQFETLETDIHSHPAIEILSSEKGDFTLSTVDSEYQKLTFAVIDANVPHKVSAVDCVLNTVMIEHKPLLVKRTLSEFNIYMKDGIYSRVEKRDFHDMLSKLIGRTMNYGIDNEYDPRVKTMVNYLNIYELEYELMVETLEQVVKLSRSRLSHIFKENIGISLKKYLLWCKLKTTIKKHLNKKEDLFTALIQSGFYDQPHFCRAFKSMLGVKPTTAYDSRIVQGLTI